MFVPTGDGCSNLAAVIDLASRFVVVWATSSQNDSALVLSALQRATVIRRHRRAVWTTCPRRRVKFRPPNGGVPRDDLSSRSRGRPPLLIQCERRSA